MNGMVLAVLGIAVMGTVTAWLRRRVGAACEEASEALLHDLPAPFMLISALPPEEQGPALDRVAQRLRQAGRDDLLREVEDHRLSLDRPPAPGR
jgi:hypothetical protein